MSCFHEFDAPTLNGALAGAATHNAEPFNTGGSPTSVREYGGLFSSEVASATNGAKVQASFDNGATWRDVATATLAPGVPAVVSAPAVAKLMRLQLVNGAGAATAAVVVPFRRRN